MLSLRAFSDGDQPYLVEYLNNLNVYRYLSPKIPSPYTLSDATWWVSTGSKNGYTYAIEYDGICIGCIGALQGEYEYSHSAEIGYWLAEPYWGKGLISKAIALLVKKLREVNIVRLHAVVFAGNGQSARVLQKSGFVQEGKLTKAICKNGQFFDSEIYSRLI